MMSRAAIRAALPLHAVIRAAVFALLGACSTASADAPPVTLDTGILTSERIAPASAIVRVFADGCTAERDVSGEVNLYCPIGVRLACPAPARVVETYVDGCELRRDILGEFSMWCPPYVAAEDWHPPEVVPAPAPWL